MTAMMGFQVWPDGDDIAIAVLMHHPGGSQEVAFPVGWAPVYLGDHIKPTLLLSVPEAQVLVDKLAACGIVASLPVSARNEEARQIIARWLAEDDAATEPPLAIEPLQLRSPGAWGDAEGTP